MRDYLDPRAFLAVLGTIAIGLLVTIMGVYIGYVPRWGVYPESINPFRTVRSGNVGGVKAFASPEEYRTYLAQATENYGMMGGFGLGSTQRAMPTAAPESFGLNEFGSDTKLGTTGAADVPNRVSQTNVQVVGIDEPDIVKTDGTNMYLSQPQYYYPMMGVRMMPGIEDVSKPFQQTGGVRTIAAFPPAALKQLGKIDVTGELLLSGKVLVVFAADKVVGYSVAKPEAPEKVWEAKYGENQRLVTARLTEGKLYVVTQAYASAEHPCPLEPFIVGETPIRIPCGAVYHPTSSVPVDSSFSVVSFDPATGEVKGRTSFLGSSSQSLVAMFGENIYITYAFPGDVVGFIVGALQDSHDLLPAWLLDKVVKLRGYDISLEAKLSEFGQLMDKYQRGLSNDERLRLENELQNRMSRYAAIHQRELERTGIVRVRVSDLKVMATGDVPGNPLNQFALDEYEGFLRVATTFGGGWFGGMVGGGSSSSASDVYVLDDGLREVGSVKDMGKTERIYSVRFVGERGYVVTFRQTDPFYVLDLRNPRSPKLSGELKIPGFSSYLHPLAKDRILGVGQESGKVKLSLFDVSNPADPREVSKYLLDDYWSEVSQTHHAFLQDERHGVVFLPGGKGGYVFSYRGDELKLASAISDIRARRALYLGDYLYVVADDKISVLNEADWTKVNELTLGQ